MPGNKGDVLQGIRPLYFVVPDLLAVRSVCGNVLDLHQQLRELPPGSEHLVANLGVVVVRDAVLPVQPAGGRQDFRGLDLQTAPPPGGSFLQLSVRRAGDEGERRVLDDLVGGEAHPVFRVVQGEEGAQQRLRVVAVAHIGLVPDVLRDDQPALLLPELHVGFPGGEAQEGGGVRRPQPILAGLQPSRPVLADDDQRIHHIITMTFPALISSASFSSKYATMDALACIFHIPPSASNSPTLPSSSRRRMNSLSGCSTSKKVR